MGQYNPEELEKQKYGLLGIYITDLQELQNGDIPTCFETHAEMLREALPFFPYEERLKYQEILEAGSSQVDFLRASQRVNALKDKEPFRKKVIDDFLAPLVS